MNNIWFCLVYRWLFVAVLVSVSACSEARNLDDIAIHDQSATLSLSDGVSVSLRFLPFNSVEVVYHSADDANLPGLALAPGLRKRAPVMAKTGSGYTLTDGDTRVSIATSPFSLSFSYRGNTRVAEASGYFDTATLRGFRFRLNDDEKLYGGGQRVLGMDRRGQKMPLYNRAHYGYTTESSQMYYSLPAVLSSENYAILFDNTARGTLDIGASENNILQFSAVAGRRAYIVTLGASTREVATNVVQVTGRQPLPSRWVLGSFASRFGYRSEQQTRDVVERFKQADMPLDAVVLDLYWFGKDVKGHMGNLEWDDAAFPSPRRMITDFNDKNIQTVLITEPFVLTSSGKYEQASDANALAKGLSGEPKTFDFFFGNTGLVDIFSEDGQAWFSAQYTRLLEYGVAGFWGDLGEPEVHPQDTLHNWQGRQVTADEIHNAYGHQWAEMVFNTLKQAQPEKRPFVLMRSGFLGSQRFGMIPWTGDVSRSWGGLKPQVELALQMSVFGLAYTHSDLGGFAGGESFDPELYTRWLQLGEFQPVFRPHAQEDIAPEPVFHGKAVQQTARAILKRRYEMLPYNYSLMVQNTLTGLPLMRPVSFYHQGSKWFDHDDSYYWGPSILVSPVTEPVVEQWDTDLPPGSWFLRGTDERFEGGQSVSIQVNDAGIPVFIKNGAIIPRIAAVNNTADADFSVLNVHVWAGQGLTGNTFNYYEDDGVTAHDPADSDPFRIKFSVNGDAQQVALKAISAGHYEGASETRAVVWHIHGLDAPPQSVTAGQQGASTVPYDWNAGTNILRVHQNFQQQIGLTLARGAQ